MPKRARVFLVEDDPTTRKIVLRVLDLDGHTVPLVASSLEEAKEKAELVEKEKIDVVILDGSLSQGSTDDGRTIAAILRQKNLGITIIGWSAVYEADWGDVNLDKTKEIAKIGGIINDLPEKGK